MFCNFALGAAVLAAGGLDRVNVSADAKDSEKERSKRATIYMGVVLWSVAGLSLFRFIGAIWFLVVRMFRGV